VDALVTEPAQEQRQETSRGAAEKTQELASQAKEQVQQKTEQVKGQATDRLREQLNDQAGRLGDRVQPFPEALRRAGAYLDSQGNAQGASAATNAADRAEQLASYLHEADGDRILGDLEDFARRRPWVVGAVATTAGFVAARFLVASSQRRYENRYPSAQPSPPSQPGWEEPR
jgi:gas vesicle protein